MFGHAFRLHALSLAVLVAGTILTGPARADTEASIADLLAGTAVPQTVKLKDQSNFPLCLCSARETICQIHINRVWIGARCPRDGMGIDGQRRVNSMSFTRSRSIPVGGYSEGNVYGADFLMNVRKFVKKPS